MCVCLSDTHGDDEAGVGGVFLHQQVTLLLLLLLLLQLLLSSAPCRSSWRRQQRCIMGKELSRAGRSAGSGLGGYSRRQRAEFEAFADWVHSGET